MGIKAVRHEHPVSIVSPRTSIGVVVCWEPLSFACDPKGPPADFFSSSGPLPVQCPRLCLSTPCCGGEKAKRSHVPAPPRSSAGCQLLPPQRSRSIFLWSREDHDARREQKTLSWSTTRARSSALARGLQSQPLCEDALALDGAPYLAVHAGRPTTPQPSTGRAPSHRPWIHLPDARMGGAPVTHACSSTVCAPAVSHDRQRAPGAPRVSGRGVPCLRAARCTVSGAGA